MLRDFLNLLFPQYCLLCEAVLVTRETLICTACFDALPQTNCHRELDNIVTQKLAGRLPINRAIALYRFRKYSKVQRLLHSLKYQHKPMLGRILGLRYGSLLKSSHLHIDFDLIVPVPLHSSRLRQRGYNQSDAFARGLSEELSIPWSRQYLVRTQKTVTQTKKSKLARFKRLERVFKVINATEIMHKHVLLVDDIITTGATVEACGRLLLAAGIKALSVAAIAVAE